MYAADYRQFFGPFEAYNRSGGCPLKARLARAWALAFVLFLGLAFAPVRFAPDAPHASRTRAPALAGSWYPDGRASLTAAAHLLMRVSLPSRAPLPRPLALVVPHAGWNFSGPVAGAAYGLLEPGAFDRVVVVGPSHHEAFRGFLVDDATAWRSPAGDVPLCEGALAALAGEHVRAGGIAFGPEHSLEIELPFLQAALGRFCLVPVLVGDTDAEVEAAFAARLAKLDDGHTLFVFSSDFSHYGPRFDFQPFGPLSPPTLARVRELDGRAVELLQARDAGGFRRYLHETGNTICGRHGLATLLELLPRIAPAAGAVTLGRYASADIPGLKDDSSVAYVSLAFLREAPPPAVEPLAAPPRLGEVPPGTPALDQAAGTRLVRLARAALDTELRGGDELQRVLADWPKGPQHEWRQGVFVTLNRTDPEEIRKLGRLRGCIGQPEPAFPLYYGTVQAALDAALRDTRFEKVTATELPRLQVEVTVLSPRRSIASASEIRIGTHGVVLEKDGKAALFLPQVAPEQGWNVEQTLDALCGKAGLPNGAWREGARLSVFTGQVFAEER
jgi:AmmeMemoRadiSam system protein B/AmmeMemoRadiSam system protein A